MLVASVRRVLAAGSSALVVTIGALSVGVVAAAPAYADSTYSMEAQFVAKINAARQASGLSPYAVASDLTSVARGHSNTMASKQSLYHNPSLTSEVSNWRAVGENVGDGPDVNSLHEAFMNSPPHRKNILRRSFKRVGVGVVTADGRIWVTVVFAG